MKKLFVVVLGVVLIALGAIGDHVLNPSAGQPSAAPAKSKSAPAGPVNITTSYSPSRASMTSAISASAIDQATEHAYAVAGRSVVYVDNVGNGTGSGIIYDSNGDIVTNAHVVNGATTIKVTLNNGRIFTAHLVGSDAADDLAVIHINAPGLTPAKFAQAGTFQVAQTVLAIGSPLGLKQSVTSGLISGLGRVEQEPNGAYLPNAIQTSAAINPGNSGGALVTLDGVVVGMPTLEQTSSQDGTTAQNVGFALPSPRITDLANQIIASGKVQHTGRAYLGISPSDSANQSTSPFGGGLGPFGSQGGTTVEGAYVQQVASNGPAGKAGIQQGDVITAVNGTSISSAEDLLTVLAQKKPGDSVTLQLSRNGSAVTVHVQLGELPA